MVAIIATMNAPSAVSSAVRRAQHAGTSWPLPGTDLPLLQCVSRVSHQVQKDAIPVLAGNIAFRLMFAFFPTIISILWLLNVVNAGQLGSEVSDLVSTVVPGAANAPLKQQIQDAPKSPGKRGVHARGGVVAGGGALGNR